MFQAVNIIDYDQEAVLIVVDYFNGRLKCLLDVMKLLIQMQGLNQRKGEVVINAVDPENMSDAGIGSMTLRIAARSMSRVRFNWSDLSSSPELIFA